MQALSLMRASSPAQPRHLQQLLSMPFTPIHNSSPPALAPPQAAGLPFWPAQQLFPAIAHPSIPDTVPVMPGLTDESLLDIINLQLPDNLFDNDGPCHRTYHSPDENANSYADNAPTWRQKQ